MRFKSLALFIFILVGVIWWWAGPSRSTIAPQSQASSESTTQASVSKSKEDTDFKSVKRPEFRAYAKAVGSGGKATPAIVRPAKNGAGADGHDTSPMERYDGLKLSSPVKVNSRPALILGARAVPTSLYNNSFGPVLFEQDGYSIVALNTAEDSSWSELVMHDSDRPLLVNPSNGHLDVVTGTLVVKLADIKEADRLGGVENLQLLSVDEAINVAYYRAPENFHLLPGAAGLSKNPAVLSVEIEVVKAIKGVR